MLTSPLLVLYALLLASVVFSSPLPLSVDKWVADKGGDVALTPAELATHQANKNEINTAVTDANSQIQKMKTVLAAPNDPKHKAVIEAAFGTKADLGIVSNNVNKLETGAVKMMPKEQTYKIPKIGATNWKENAGTWQPSSIGFGKDFYSASAAARTGTVIHEAAHYVNNAGDWVLSDRKKTPVDFDIHKGLDKVPSNRKYEKDANGNGVSGYTKSYELPKTVAEVTADTSFTSVRDKVSNMHDNAESYAVFGSLCANLPRREFHLLKRALGNGDKEEFQRLWRRGSCKRPANGPGSLASKQPLSKTAKGTKLMTAAKSGSQIPRPTTKKSQSKVTKGTKLTTTAKSGSQIPRPTTKQSQSKVTKGTKLTTAAKSGSQIPRPTTKQLQSKATKGTKLTTAAKSGSQIPRPTTKQLQSKATKGSKSMTVAKSGSQIPRPATQPQTKATKGSKLPTAPKSGSQIRGPVQGSLRSVSKQTTQTPKMVAAKSGASSTRQSKASPTKPTPTPQPKVSRVKKGKR